MWESFIMQSFELWQGDEYNPTKMEWYEPKNKKSNGAVIIFPGGAYTHLAKHEGQGYAEALNEIGITAFVVYYRVVPNRFPLQLLDARRAVRFVRANAEKFGVDKDKICAMGSSAGGHLTALLSTYTKELAGETNDEIDRISYIPNGQILCYPAISSDENIAHPGCFRNLLGDDNADWKSYDPALLAHENTPKAFVWHTASDPGVKVLNSYAYATALYNKGIPCEMHVFPYGGHGLGLADGQPHSQPHVAQWFLLLKNWLILHEFL